MSNQDPARVITGEVRLSYLWLNKPDESYGEPRYKATILLPKTDIQTKQMLDAAVEIIKQSSANTWGGFVPPVLRLPINDGDGGRPTDGMPYGPECSGHFVFSAWSKDRPDIVDINLQPILNASEIYSGMYARVSVSFFAYNNSGNKGIGCFLGNIQKTRDGEPLVNRVSAAQEFSQFQPVQQPGYATTQPQQPVYQAPVQATQPQQAAYQQTMQPAPIPGLPQSTQFAINPITGQPTGTPPGGVMGLQ